MQRSAGKAVKRNFLPHTNDEECVHNCLRGVYSFNPHSQGAHLLLMGTDITN